MLTRESVKKELFNHIRAYHGFNDEQIGNMGISALLAHCHPLYRKDYAKKLESIDMLDKDYDLHKDLDKWSKEIDFNSDFILNR